MPAQLIVSVPCETERTLQDKKDIPKRMSTKPAKQKSTQLEKKKIHLACWEIVPFLFFSCEAGKIENGK